MIWKGIARTTVYPFVIKGGNGYHMWYGGHTSGKFEIFHATSDNGSDDGSKWAVDHRRPAFPARSAKTFFDSRYPSTPCIVSRPGRHLLYCSALEMRTTYVDAGTARGDGSGIHAHLGVAVLAKP